MNIDAMNLVSADEFRGHCGRYLQRAKKGLGPIAVSENDQVIGVFIGAADFEAMAGRAMKELLESRLKGPTISHDEAMSRIEAAIKRKKRRA